MPAYIAHTLFGESLADRLPEDIRQLVSRNSASYSWGLQGPDILFFRKALRGGSPLNQLGKEMHRTEIEHLFSAMASYCITRRGMWDEEAVLAYFIGFIGHYATDSICHPYIYWLQGRMEGAFPPGRVHGLHHTVESDMDTTLYRLRHYRSVRSFPVDRYFSLSRPVTAPIALLYVAVLETVYGRTVSPGEIILSMEEAVQICRLTLDPTGGILTGALQLAESVSGQLGHRSSFVRREVHYDVLNLDRRAWYPFGGADAHYESVPELLAEAQQLALSMVEEAVPGIRTGRGYRPEHLVPFDWGRPEEEADTGCEEEAE